MSSNRFKTLLAALIGMLLLAAPVTASAQGLNLTEARDQGLIGERPDGLVGIVARPSAQLTSLVDDVNQARMVEYRKLASARNVPVAAVQAIAGEEQIARAAARGWMVMDASGQWRPGG